MPEREPLPGVFSEPWLRGVLPGLDPVIGHLIRSIQQIREDLRAALEGASTAYLQDSGAGFHARHLAGSTQRLTAYLQGRQLTPSELEALAAEGFGEETAAQLIDKVNHALDTYETELRALKPEDFASLREVGRSRLPVTAIGLAIHIAEHGQRHTGQAITAIRSKA